MKITKNISSLISLWAFAIPQFFLGLGIVNYLGISINWTNFWLGLIWIVLTGFVSIYLFLLTNEMIQYPNQIRYKFREYPYRIWLLIVGLAVVLLFILTIGLADNHSINPASATMMVMIFFGSFFLGMKPLRLFFSGYGELVMAIILGFLIPAFSLMLQTQELHRLLIFSTIPIGLLIFSFQLVKQIENYESNIRGDEKRLIARIGWENGFVLHNSLIIIAYLMVGVAGLLGFPQKIALPVFISLPLAILQIWHIQQIANGAKPRWKFLQVNNILIISSVLFIFVLSFWIR